MDHIMNEEQELAALEAELAELEAEVKAVVTAEEIMPEPEPQPEPVAEVPKPRKAKKPSPKAEDVKPQPIDPKAAAVQLYGAQRLAAWRASRGLR